MKNKIKKIVALALIAFISVGITAGVLAIVKNDAGNSIANTTIAVIDDNADKVAESTQNSISNNLATDNKLNNAYDVITLVDKEETLAEQPNSSDTGSSSNICDGAFLLGTYINSAKDFLTRYNTNYFVGFEQRPVTILAMAVEEEMPIMRKAAYSTELEDVLYVGTQNRFAELVEAPAVGFAAKAQLVSKNNDYDDLAAFVKWHLFKENNGNIIRAIHQLNEINNGSNYDNWMTFSSDFTDYKYGNMYPKKVANTMDYQLDRCDQIYATNTLKRGYSFKENNDYAVALVREDSIKLEKLAVRRINPFEKIIKAYIEAENRSKQEAIDKFNYCRKIINEYNTKQNEHLKTLYTNFYNFITSKDKATKKAHVVEVAKAAEAVEAAVAAEAVCAEQEVAVASALEMTENVLIVKSIDAEFIPDEGLASLLVEEVKDAESVCDKEVDEIVDAVADSQPAVAEPEPAVEAPVQEEIPPAAPAQDMAFTQAALTAE